MTLPQTYVIGAPKAGTTSLAAWLADHPQVYFSVPKEPFYWASDYPAMRRHYGFESRDSYEKLFSSSQARAATLRAEGSTIYLYSLRAIPDILAAVARPKFIVALRNPVDLLASYHRTQLVALNETEPDFATAWRRSLTGIPPATTPLDAKLVDYPRVGRLGEAVARVVGLVPRQDFHPVFFHELAQEPSAVWGKLMNFLEISSDCIPTLASRNASDKMYRSKVLHRMIQRPPALLTKPIGRLRQWSRTTDNTVAARAKQATWRRESRPVIAEDVQRDVAAHFSEDIELLAETLKIDLSDWGTFT